MITLNADRMFSSGYKLPLRTFSALTSSYESFWSFPAQVQRVTLYLCNYLTLVELAKVFGSSGEDNFGNRYRQSFPRGAASPAVDALAVYGQDQSQVIAIRRFEQNRGKEFGQIKWLERVFEAFTPLELAILGSGPAWSVASFVGILIVTSGSGAGGE